MIDENKLNRLMELRYQAEFDIQKVKKILENNPKDKGLLNCLNQAIDTFQACNLFIRICNDLEDDVCWSLNCIYYENNDHFIKGDGSINKWCVGCCNATGKDNESNQN